MKRRKKGTAARVRRYLNNSTMAGSASQRAIREGLGLSAREWKVARRHLRKTSGGSYVWKAARKRKSTKTRRRR